MARNPVENRKTFSSELPFPSCRVIAAVGKRKAGLWSVTCLDPQVHATQARESGSRNPLFNISFRFQKFYLVHILLFQCQTRIPCIHTYICMAISQHQGFCYFFGNRNKLSATHRLSLSTKGMGVNFCFPIYCLLG